jgi:alanine racemase
MAVVKANAYGHGLVQIARLLDGVDALAVARVSEGVELRAAGVEQRIVVLEGCGNSAELAAAVQYQLDVVVHDPSHFVLLASVAEQNVLDVWIKLDTGMGRLGFNPGDLAECRAQLDKTPVVRSAARIMTHLASADDPDDPMTMEQVRRFGDALGFFQGDVSIANSAGLLLWPQTLEPSLSLDYRGDNWVRPGLALYGASPVTGKSAREMGLEPVMSFESRLISVKTVVAGSSVGYGSNWTARRDTVVGVAAVGYGDGYPRHLKSGTPVLVNGRRVALIGTVSMDLISLDLTDVPVAEVGDPVVLWGGHLPIEEIATRAETIPYELMCGLSQRVEYRLESSSAEGSEERSLGAREES